jgi:hypothetical protein
MPSGRDSFRRNRVAPICYDSIHFHYITPPKSHVATGWSATPCVKGLEHIAVLLALLTACDS